MNMEQMQNNERDAAILRYTGISAELLSAEDAEKIDKLESERNEIELDLGMTSEEIILEAKKLLIK